MRVLVANRGDVAVRVCRAVAGLGGVSVAVHVPGDAGALHVRLAGEAWPLPGSGVAGYLDAEALVRTAVAAGCTHVHPGWGFLSEDAGFARACAGAGLVFVGPSPEALELFGDKARAREHARAAGVPVLEATEAGVTLAEARAFLAAHPAGVMVKAAAGGGGRGMRAVTEAGELADAFERCRSEARHAFGSGELYVERLLAPARHVEVQVLGDGGGTVVHLGERECSVQRRHQKLLEVAPCPSLDDAQRATLSGYAVRIAESVPYAGQGPGPYVGLGTVEFLLDAGELARGVLDAVFIETNPRLQVEHTVTEEVTGVDLVRAQLRIADGATLDGLGLTQDRIPAPDGFAVQSRVNAERTAADGTARAATGTLTAFRAPGGPGVRVDGAAEAGLEIDGSFDSLLAKVVTHTRHGGFAAAVAAADRALGELEVAGVATNTAVLRGVLGHPEFAEGRATTGFLARIADQLPVPEEEGRTGAGAGAGAGTVAAAFPGTVVSVSVGVGDAVTARTPLAVVEAMKMEHVLTAGRAGVVTAIEAGPGDQLAEGDVLLRLDPSGESECAEEAYEETDPAYVRPDLEDLSARRARVLDGARPEAVERRHARGHRTIRENLADLVDPGSFTEYGALAVAAQRRRRSLDDLMAATPADGMVLGLASVNGGDAGGTSAPDPGMDSGADFRTDSGASGTPRTSRTSRCVVMGYDYTVLAGTQGFFGHAKTDRMLKIAHQRALPVVLFAEGGGGRPGDTDPADIASSWLDCATFAAFGRLSGRVPTVGVLTGRCFAGNAALLGSCDVVIATKDSTLGMAGPAMIEGGGLGRFAPEEVGPMSVQVPNGVVDVLVEDDAEAVATAKKYLSYFQGPQEKWISADQRGLRHLVPENRLRVYDVRRVVETLADTGSVLELRRGFGHGAVTALVRIEGRPMGLVANDPAHLGGAIDADAADKMARFLQLCDAHGLPVVSLCDTPGFMVGPQSERAATVRHFSRLFVIGAHLDVPLITVVLRKGYGLGAQAMAAGGWRETLATVAWPTGEMGPMGLEGAVRLGYAKELAALPDDEQRRQRYEQLLAQHYESGKAVNAAMVFEIDDVIDPAETRRWVTEVVGDRRPEEGRGGRGGRGRTYIDTW